EYIKRVALISCATVIRLKRFDDAENGRRQIFYSITKSLGGIWAHAAYRERSGAAGALPDVCDGKLPRKLIQAGAKAISEFPNQTNQIRRDRFGLKPNDMPMLLNLILFRDSVHTFSDQSGMFTLDLIEMDFCPVHLNHWKDQTTL